MATVGEVLVSKSPEEEGQLACQVGSELEMI
jgi:hypothetical protein